MIPAVVVLDRRVLDQLESAHADRDLMRAFAAEYRSLLPVRVDRLGAAVVRGDVAGALDAALSLKSSSRAVGTRALAALAHEVELLLRTPDLPRASVVTARLTPAALDAHRALGAYLAG